MAEQAQSQATTGQTDQFVVKSPVEVGEHTRTAIVPPQATKEGDLQPESAVLVPFVVEPHVTSIAVWDIPSPLVVDTDFKIKIGVKCTGGCNLGGQTIEIYDHAGARVTSGILGDLPFSHSLDLYWTEVELRSPPTKGVYQWAVRLPRPDLELPHQAASLNFGFSAAEKPEHAVTITVTNQESKAPVANAHVMFRPYSGHTDDQGVVKLEAAAGEYRLHVSHCDYDSFQATVSVTGDATIQAALSPVQYTVDYRGNLWKVKSKK